VDTQHQTEGKSLAEIISIRKEKLDKIRELGYEPYSYEFAKSHSCEQILSDYESIKEELTVHLAGRIMAIRKMGRASFCHIQDETGRLQLYLRENQIGEKSYELFKHLDIGDFLGAVGKVFKTRTGEITLFADEIHLLSKNIRPIPIVKEKDGTVFDAFSDKEQRYRQRYLDLIVNPETKNVFRMRSQILQWSRDFLNQHGFLEVETPSLQPIYGGASAKPFKTHYNALNRNYFLRIAVELYLKRLIIGGFEKVYEIGKNFRNEGIDRTHNPEFTLLEFYQAYVDYNYMMDFVEDFFHFIVKNVGREEIDYGEHKIRFDQKFQRRRMFDLLKEHTGTDLTPLSEDELKEFCLAKGIELKPGYRYGKYIELIFDQFVEPHLIQPTFVMDYPKEISPLAKPKRDGNSRIVERFELYIAGKEFANAFSELNDPFDQRSRLEEQKRLSEMGDEEAQTMDEDFVVAMEHGMPPTGGVGIGIDRLVMLFTNQQSIKDVILFPQLRT